MNSIDLKKARIHNLKEIDISIPKNKLIVATGISGSGKSSLMFDIIFEEGRKEYLKSIGLFGDLEDEQKFDSISGIGPTVAVKQSVVRQANPRSTVGSRTDLLRLIGLLFFSEGHLSCSQCEEAVTKGVSCSACENERNQLDLGCFSYNNINGMCVKCSGRGAYYQVNMDRLVPNDQITVREIFKSIHVTPGITRIVERQLKSYMDISYAELPESIKNEVINGHYTNNSANQSFCLSRILQTRHKKGEYMDNLYELVACPECSGFRISDQARRVFINGQHIGEVGKMTLLEARLFFESALENSCFTAPGVILSQDILRKISSLIRSRLGHLSLYREMSSLSGGELQRLFLNSHLESKMESLIYILDEPTVGLHESEKAELLNSIYALKELGNTVIVVEHDKRTIEAADHIIDVGPKAGIEGGQVIYEGSFAGLLQCEDSLSGQYLSGKAKMPIRTLRPDIFSDEKSPRLTIHHAKTNNLKDVTVSLPLGVLVGVAGISGCGKSSLISKTLVPFLKKHFRNSSRNNTLMYNGDYQSNIEDDASLIETVVESVDGLAYLSGFTEVSQAPIGRNINSNPVTFIKIWDKIRKLFSDQPEARRLRLSAGHFSFNSEGACENCGGSGRQAVFPGTAMKIYITCSKCKGKRYNDAALQVRYKDKTIAEILDLQVSEAVSFFKEHKTIVATLEVMERIGMGYITLGQPTSTMSGGEAQRLKLAKEIGKKKKGNILYVMDEPTTGLSLYDTAQLIKLLDELVKDGNSVIVIEHNSEVLNSCDWIIELGPEAGAKGGKIIAEGSPQTLRDNQASITGRYLERN
ncbi:excinuclease ABC subunit UvrA [Paenibacillus wulumuqiensis]|uniref:excinuclease ABC subunit UvrA n=1 Tax=Paenibacillus wulumuqiensis TaxID=1567107 RepID=UPI0006191857|nr:excinuclease ABC subunit UvrA [Paenibacillus wulumuqiensis]